jgi:hypothetical protein
LLSFSGINHASVPEMCPVHPEQTGIFHYLLQETGGQYFTVPSDQYKTALEEILRKLYPRCQPGFRPRTA